MSRYDEYDIVRYCDICDCEDCPKYGDDCDGNTNLKPKTHGRKNAFVID